MTLPAFTIEARDLACERGGRRVFSGLSFRVGAGEMMTLVGPNGSGKSSLLRVIAGLVPIAEGALTIKRRDPPLPGEEAPASTFLHFLAHQDGLKAQMTAGETLSYYRALLAPSSELMTAGTVPDVAAALSAAGLGRLHDLPVQYLSAGQRRRLALARLIAAPRPIWLLDEPLAALDEAGRKLLDALMGAHLADGGLVVAATHDILWRATRSLDLSLSRAAA